MIKRLVVIFTVLMCYTVSVFSQSRTEVTLTVNVVKITDEDFLTTFRKFVLPILKRYYPDKDKCIIVTSESIERPGEHYAHIEALNSEYMTSDSFNDNLKSMAVIDGYRVFFQSELMLHTFDQYFKIIGKEDITFDVFPKGTPSGCTDWHFIVEDGRLIEFLYPPIPEE